jgi:hypothetical protein
MHFLLSFFFKFEARHIVCFYYRSNFLKKLHQEYCMTEKIRKSWEIVRHWTKNVSELKTAILGYIVKVFTFCGGGGKKIFFCKNVKFHRVYFCLSCTCNICSSKVIVCKHNLFL